MGVDLYFNNQGVASGVTEINFAGTVELTRNDDGSVKVQIGENQNSSSWNTKDGQTDASVANIANTVHLWTFDPVNGRVQFRSDDTPTKGWGTAGIYLTAVAYVGKSVTQRLEEIEQNAGGAADAALAIKPFTFDSTSMDKSDPSLEKYTNTPYMVIRKTVPAYVFEVSTADNKTLITEIEHTSNGDSIVYVAVEAASGDAGADPKDTTSFIATGFVKADGSKITLLGSQAI